LQFPDPNVEVSSDDEWRVIPDEFWSSWGRGIWLGSVPIRRNPIRRNPNPNLNP